VAAWTDWPSEWHVGRPTAAAIDLPEPVAISAPAFRLLVPHRTQKDGGPWQTSNCGPAALGMVLDGFGVVGQATDDLRFRSHTYQGTVGRRTGTALQHIAHVAEDFGLSARGLYDPSGEFHAWSLDEVRAELRQGHPVMPLVRLYLMPGYETSLPRWGHYVLLTGMAESGFFYNDPLDTDSQAGRGKYISSEQLGLAMGNSHIPGQAVAFAGPARATLAVWTP
jgi:hypothetical protein